MSSIANPAPDRAARHVQKLGVPPSGGQAQNESNSAPTAGPAPPSKWPLRALQALAVLTLVITLAGLPWPRFAQPQTAPPAEVLLSDLVRQDNRLFHKAHASAFTGLVIERHGDGTLKSRSTVSNGLLQGLSEGFHPSGQLEVQEHFQSGVSHGVRTKWHADGTKLSEAEIVEGKLHGTFRRWHENGLLAEEILMRDGRPNGPSRAYYPSGCLKALATLENGQLLTRQHWPDGERTTDH